MISESQRYDSPIQIKEESILSGTPNILIAIG